MILSRAHRCSFHVFRSAPAMVSSTLTLTRLTIPMDMRTGSGSPLFSRAWTAPIQLPSRPPSLFDRRAGTREDGAYMRGPVAIEEPLEFEIVHVPNRLSIFVDDMPIE